MGAIFGILKMDLWLSITMSNFEMPIIFNILKSKDDSVMGQPVLNAFVESFNGNLRGEMLYGTQCSSLTKVREESSA